MKKCLCVILGTMLLIVGLLTGCNGDVSATKATTPATIRAPKPTTVAPTQPVETVPVQTTSAPTNPAPTEPEFSDKAFNEYGSLVLYGDDSEIKYPVEPYGQYAIQYVVVSTNEEFWQQEYMERYFAKIRDAESRISDLNKEKYQQELETIDLWMKVAYFYFFYDPEIVNIYEKSGRDAAMNYIAKQYGQYANSTNETISSVGQILNDAAMNYLVYVEAYEADGSLLSKIEEEGGYRAGELDWHILHAATEKASEAYRSGIWGALKSVVKVIEGTKPSIIVATQTPTEPTTAEPVDELALLRTTFEIAAKDQGVFLVRGDKIYTLNEKTSKVPGVDYSFVCEPVYRLAGFEGIKFYDHSRNISGYRTVLGDIPTPVLAKGDKIIVFSDKFFDLELSPANFAGYSARVDALKALGENNYRGFDRYGVRFFLDLDKETVTDIAVTDVKGNILEDYSSFEKDGIYTLSWYEGTRYNEVELIADCLQFDYNYKGTSDHIFVTGTLTKEGYAEYDISHISSGLYVIKTGDGRTGHGGLIEIP